MADLVGKTLGKYRITERLGRGGMSEVYRGRHPRLDREVAIKVLHPHLAEGSDFLARFEREAKAAAALRHPHIVQIYDFDVEDGAFYMVMEYVGGGTLKDRLAQLAARREHLPLAEVGRIIGQLAGALDYAHAHGVLHRDVKPSNVLLDPSGRAVLADFGIAQIVGGARYTTTGTLMGTPAYMSPEQCRGDDLTAPSDLYALGVVLYELLTGRVPFDADTPLGIAHKQIHEPLPPPRTFRPDLPPALEPVLLKALAKEPVERYHTAAEMVTAVEGALAAGRAGPETVVSVEAAAAPAPEPPCEEAAPEVEAQATEVMREPLQVDLGASQTVLMAEEPAPAVDALATAPAAGAEAPSPETSRGGAPPAAARVGRRTLLVGGGLAALALIAVVVAVVFSDGGPSPCATAGECERLAHEAMGRGDLQAAVALVGRALDLAPPSERQMRARLSCWRGDIYRELGRRDEAIRAFQGCIEWSEGDPGLAELLHRAELALVEVRGP